MSSLNHIFLYIVLFATFFVLTRFRQSFLNRHYWQIVAIPIVLYSIILGCRYGWGNDYLWYKSRIEQPFKYSDEDLGFGFINLFFKELGINYVGVYIFYSLLFFTCALILLKDFKYNKYMIALFLPATLLQSTATIRQAVATSFVFLAIHFLNRKQIVYVILSLIATYLIHTGAIINFVFYIVLLIISIYYNKAIPIIYSIPFYIIFSLSSSYSESYIAKFANIILPYLHFDSKMQGYLDTADVWFGVDAASDIYKQTPVTLAMNMAFHIAIIYIGYIVLKYKSNRLMVCYYNYTVIGLIFLRIVFTYEILRRIAEPIVMFYFIPTGYALFFILNRKKIGTNKEQALCKTGVVCIFVFILLYYGRFILFSPKHLFVWD